MYKLMGKQSNNKKAGPQQEDKKLYVRVLVPCINSTVTFFILPGPNHPNTCEWSVGTLVADFQIFLNGCNL
jgi:hypothetical protein